MDTARPNNSGRLITLKEASERLNVSIETLLSWNQHNILKPTITTEGHVGYTEEQLDQFLTTIHQVIQFANPHSKPSSTNLMNTQVNSPVLTSESPATNHSSEKLSKINNSKRLSSKRMISLSIIAIVVTAALTQEGMLTSSNTMQQDQQTFRNVLGIQTSKLTLSEKFLAALPTQLKSEETSQKSFQHENNESVFKEKTTSPVLYETKTNNDEEQDDTPILSAKQGSDYKINNNFAIENINDYPSTAFFNPTATDETSAIDKYGNIRGDVENDTLATVVGRIDEMVRSGSLQQSNTAATSQLLVILLGFFAIIFAFQKQLAFVYPGKKLSIPQDSFINPVALTSQKVLEVDQKTDGTVVFYFQGNEYKISKPELNSESDQFIERLMTFTQPNLKEIEYDTAMTGAIKFTTPLSRLVTRLGFVGIKRDLFFPRTSKNTVLFRKYLTQQDLAVMNLTTSQVLDDLIKSTN